MNFSEIIKQFNNTIDYLKKTYIPDQDTSLLIKGFFSSLFVRATGVAFRFLISILLARILGSSGYGIFTYSVSWMAFLSVISMFGIEYVIIRYFPSYLELKSWSNLKGFLRFVTYFGLLSSLTIALISIIIVAFFINIEFVLRNTLIVTLIIIPILNRIQIQQYIFRSLQYPGLGQIPEHIIYPLSFAIFIFIAYIFMRSNLNAFHISIANTSSFFITVLVSVIILFKIFPLELKNVKSTFQFSQWINMIPSLAFVAIAYQVFSRAPLLILGTQVSNSEIGIYVASSRGAEFIDFVYGAMTIAGSALFSSINIKNDKNALQIFTGRVNNFIFILTLPVFLLLMIFTPQFLMLFGADFVAGVNIMRILLITYFLSSLFGFVEFMIPTTGNQRDLANAVGIMAFVNAGLSFILIHLFGLIGAAFATSISVILFRITLVILLYKRTRIISLPFINLIKK